MTKSIHDEERERRKRRSRGITLLELLVVLAILALIATFAGPRLLNILSGAKTDAAKIQIDSLATTLDLYRLEVGQYPGEDEGLQALVERPAGNDKWNGPYLTKREALIDPWGNPYRYRFPGELGDFDIYSLGADNAEGGEGEDQDVSYN
jgi:general secretion pathway protein G